MSVRLNECVDLFLSAWNVSSGPPVLWPTPVVVEINSDDRRETALYGRRIWLYNEVHRLATLPIAAGFVCVTHELARTLGRLGRGRPTAVIANGIETLALPDCDAAMAGSANGSGDRAVMLIGSSPVPSWNGVDRVLGLAEAMPEMEFDLVGPLLSADLGHRPPNVHLHGMLPLAGYAPLLARANFALGPLALYRKGMSEACPLKVREYLLHGLPVLTSHEDTDFIGQDPWFIRRLTNADGDVRAEVPAIRGWLDDVGGRRVPREAVLPRLGTDAKERERLAFFRHVLERSPRRGMRRCSSSRTKTLPTAIPGDTAMPFSSSMRPPAPHRAYAAAPLTHFEGNVAAVP
jgi:hypothetical protein